MKDNLILKHYKNIIENNLFDEYDILGLLIFIREKVDKSYCHSIFEFSNLVAHRKRDCGMVYDCINNAINNKYKTDKNGKLIGYHGIKNDVWQKEWQKFSQDFNIKINEITLKEITVCICSLSQDSIYAKHDPDDNIGKVELFIDMDGYFSLCTSECRRDSRIVCFLKGYQFKIINDPEDGFFNFPVETKRESGILKLYYQNQVVFEVNKE